jgi:hypothetical protein
VLLKKFNKLVSEAEVVRGKIKGYLEECETHQHQLVSEVKNIITKP